MKTSLFAALTLTATALFILSVSGVMTGTADASPPSIAHDAHDPDKKDDKKDDKKEAPEAEPERTPATLYTNYCSSCHDIGLATAPKTADNEAWTALLKSRGLKGIVDNTIKGAGLMPARGACFDCTDKEIESVVMLMLEKAKVDPTKVLKVP